ncbi:C-type lectin domain-containing protein [Caenorhabditis elegans]|uniref:C-type lectin domain-containing protein n=1 Tax=Caenorhabditis elegans TaxID=6239 RepID=Q7YTL4_CAEEL|nr:C-type lectin domain-containing protein [Caenorhabditis elegans]CAE17891.2 C-type lectin domain-containing protein [Caenorhabditis elegans]|eukprot:NP_001023323.2 C-type LECtin [Caenorhabditis elegans]
MKVAFKVKTAEGSCPDIEGSPVTGDASTTTFFAKIQNYTITFIGTFEKFSMSRCEEGWAFFKRESVNWCFTSVTKTDVTYSAAEASCVQFGATLSGLESQLEANAVVSILQTSRSQKQLQSIYMRIDGQRTEECQETPTTENCMSIDGLTRHDKGVKNFDAYQFMTDSSAGATDGKNCMVSVCDGVNDGKIEFAECEISTSYSISYMLCGCRIDNVSMQFIVPTLK